MIHEYGYGNTVQKVDIPDKNLIAELHANSVPHRDRAVRYALDNPIGSKPLRDIAKPGKKIAIITSDISRPFPTSKVLPLVLDELYDAGIKKEDITVVFALGSHRHHTDEERRKLAGSRCFDEVKCIDGDPDDCVHMGTTKNGTPVDITRSVASSDIKICLGNIEFHYFAGYSGGAKAIMPGVSTSQAIQANHRLMTDENAHAGNIDTNPIRQDIEEAGKICGIDFIVNVVLDEHKEIVYAVAGDAVEAHRAGCKYLDQMYRVEIPSRADIVIVSQGGAPKDANLYQTQKALDNSKHAVKEGGTIILIGACPEGLGSAKFEEWLTQAKTSHEMVDRIKTDFQLGGHKAAAIGMVLEYSTINLISEMDDDFVRSIFLEPKHSAQEAFDDAMKKYGENATVISMPFGGATLPSLKG